MKSVGAVVAGFVVTFALSLGIDALWHALDVFPPWGVRMSDGLFAFALAYRCLATIAGGVVTVKLAPSSPFLHAVALAIVGGVAGAGGVVVAMTHPDMGPLWYPVALLVLSVACVFIGARIGRPA